MATLYKIVNRQREFKESGSRVQAIQWNEDDTFKEVVGTKPVIGCGLLVGSVTARSYSKRDYWLTTTVTEILEDNTFRVRFKTLNSIYELVW